MRMRRRFLSIAVIAAILFTIFIGTTGVDASNPENYGTPFDGYIVKLTAEPSGKSAFSGMSLFSALSNDLEPVPYIDGLFIADDPDIVGRLIASGIVEYVEPNYILEPLGGETSGFPNDPKFLEQWTLDVINYLSLYTNGYNGDKVKKATVAIIDSGLYAWRDESNTYHGHEEFEHIDISEYSKNFLGTASDAERSPYYYRDQSLVGHGTFVASQIAAETNNGLGIAGIADKVELMVLRCLSSSGSNAFPYDARYDANSGSTAVIASAIRYAADHGADVINMSLGAAIDSSLIATLQEAVDYAHSKGVIVVAATGNDSGTELFYPAACQYVIGVGSVSKTESGLAHSGFSQHNSSVSVTAPGDLVFGASVYPSGNGIVYTNPQASYIRSSGTSYSAPVVSAMAAIAKSINPYLDHDDFESILAVTSNDLGTSGWDAYFGYGVLDAEKVLEALTETDYGIDYILKDSEEARAALPDGYASTYELDRTEDLILPVPTRDGYIFEGWYETEDYSTEAITVLPRGAFGIARSLTSGGSVSYYIENIKLYAKWSESRPLEIQSITVLDEYEARLKPESADTFEVTIPASAISSLEEMEASDISVTASSNEVSADISLLSVDEIEKTARWEIELSFGTLSAVYYLDIKHSDYEIPAVKEDALNQSGTAMLPSFDGSSPAEEYRAEISSCYTDAATDYEIVSSDGAGEAEIETVFEGMEPSKKAYLVYTPGGGTGGDYKGKTVTIEIKGKNDDFESKDTVTVRISIGRKPSDSVILTETGVYDLYTDSGGFTVNINTYGNNITGILRNGVPGNVLVPSDKYDISYADMNEDNGYNSAAVGFKHSFLSSLPLGANEFTFNFSEGEAAPFSLTINDSAPRFNVYFYAEKTDSEPFYTVYNIRISDKLTLPPTEPSKEGYNFVGWYLEDDNTRVTSTNTTVTSSFNVYAKWAQNTGGVPIGGGGGGGIFFPIPLPEIPEENPEDTTTDSDLTVSVSDGTQVIPVKAVISDNVVSVEEPSDTELKDIIDAASKAGKPVHIDLSSVSEKAEEVQIPGGILSSVAGSDVPGLDITMPDGKKVSFDSTAVEAFTSTDSGSLRLSVHEVAPAKLTQEQKSLVGNALVISLTAHAGETQVHNFKGGMATISIPADGKNIKYPVVWRMTTDSKGNVNLEPIECTYNAATKCYEFKTGSFSEYALANYPFTDTPKNAWYYEDVAYAYVNGLFSGTSDRSFSPENTMTRGMLVTVLWRMEGRPAVSEKVGFSDVSPSAYYADAVAWASANSIVGGFGNGRFGPDNNITREQMAAILFRYAQYKGYDVSAGENDNILSYKDAIHISNYAVPAFQWTCGVGLLQGSDGRLMPQGEATRAQVAAILHRFNSAVGKH